MPKRSLKPTRPPVYTPRGIRTAQQPGQPAAAAAMARMMVPAMMGLGRRPEMAIKGKRGRR